MLQTFLIRAAAGFDGTTSFAVPDPSPAAAPETGIISFTVSTLAGILDPASLHRFVGPGGYLLAGVSVASTEGNGTVQVSLINPSASFSSQQMISTNFFLATAPAYAYRPTYVPAGWRLRFTTLDEFPIAADIRLDICALRNSKIAARAIAATRLFELRPEVA
jgi:hypothetical protein